MKNKKDIILDAAEELFSENGFEATTTRMLAKKAGVNIAMISYYFGSKEKLFEAFVEDRAVRFRQKLEMLNEKETDPWKRLDGAIDLYADRVFSNQKFHKVLQRELTLHQRPALSKAIGEILSKNADEFIKIIHEGQKKKIFKNVDVELTLATFTGTVVHATTSPVISQKLLKAVPSTDEAIITAHIKKRITRHLKSLLHSHLEINKS